MTRIGGGWGVGSFSRFGAETLCADREGAGNGETTVVPGETSSEASGTRV